MSTEAAAVDVIASEKEESPSPAKMAKLSSTVPSAPQAENESAATNGTNGSDHSNPDGVLLVKKLSENAKLPTKGSAKAVGYDLYRLFFVSILI